MKLSAEILEELNNVSPLLAGIEKTNVFSVPEGYFDTVAIDLYKRINADVPSRTLTVPARYFDNLSTDILSKVKSQIDNPSQELRELSPMLYSIQNENVFTVPRGYFTNLENNILDKVMTKSQAKVVELNRRDTIWKYAAAAVVTGIIGLSSLMMYNTSKPFSSDKANELAVSETIKTASQFKNEQQINGAIASLSDDEIIKFLENTGTDIDNEALAKSIDESELPSTSEYLLDENTLETYLKETDKNSQN